MRKLLLALITIQMVGPGCSTMGSFFATQNAAVKQPPIENPFGEYTSDKTPRENIVLRTKKGDRSIEVELPGSTGQTSDFVVPMSPNFQDSGRSPASDGSGFDERYKDRGPSASDREITHTLPQGSAEDDGSRREIETGLGVAPSQDSTPSSDKSYLAALDRVKQLFKSSRYEAALLETDELLRAYPTDPRLYQMRGTLFERIGKTELAIKSWSQALRFDPGNQSLRKFVERKQQKRSLASP